MRVVLASVVFASVALHGCAVLPCTLIGCTSPVTVEIMPIQDPEPYASATVTLCIDDVCGAVSMPGEVPTSDGTGIGGTSSGDLVVGAYLWNEGTYRMTVELSVYGSDFRDGDAYTLSIVDIDGAVLVQHAWTADYTESSPNGERCGPDCVTHTVSLTP